MDPIPGHKDSYWKVLCPSPLSGVEEFTAAPNALRKILDIPAQQNIDEVRNHLSAGNISLMIRGTEIFIDSPMTPSQFENTSVKKTAD